MKATLPALGALVLLTGCSPQDELRAQAPPEPVATGRLPAPAPAHLEPLVVKHASRHGVPLDLAHRVIMRESRYNPAARNRSYYGLMQIAPATARGLGYRGSPQGLLDADTNLNYGMTYLGNAYRIAGGDQKRAVALYSGGYYYEAKRRGMLKDLRRGDEVASIQ